MYWFSMWLSGIVIVAFAGENPFSFHRENLLRINLVTLTDEGFTSRLLRRTSLWIRVRKIRTTRLRNIRRPCVGQLQKRFHKKNFSFIYSLQNSARNTIHRGGKTRLASLFLLIWSAQLQFILTWNIEKDNHESWKFELKKLLRGRKVIQKP